MASTMNQQFKITKLAKDLGLKSKDLVELLAQNGIEAKTTQKALEPMEFDILFEQLTLANQINDIGSYLDGVTYIPSKVKKAKPAKAEKAEESVAEPVVEKAPVAPTPSKAPEKAEKKETVAEPVQKAPEKAPVKEKVAEKTPAAPEKVSAAPAPTARPQNVATEKKEEKVVAKAEPQAAPARPAARQPYTGNPYRPQQNGLPNNYGMQQNTRPATAGRFEGRPDNRFENRPERSTFGAGAPAGAPAGARRPDSFGARDQKPAFGAPSFGNRPERGAFGQQRPDRNDRGGNNNRGGRFDHDKGDFVQSAPKDTFKAQPIVRGASTNVNPDGTRKGPRVIDTHGSTVDLSKYDERLDSFVSDRDSNLQGGNQKLKKQNNAQQGGNSFGKGKKGKDKGRNNAPAQQPVSYKPT